MAFFVFCLQMCHLCCCAGGSIIPTISSSKSQLKYVKVDLTCCKRPREQQTVACPCKRTSPKRNLIDNRMYQVHEKVAIILLWYIMYDHFCTVVQQLHGKNLLQWFTNELL